MREKEIEFSSAIDHNKAIQSMVSETFETSENSDSVYFSNGKINSELLIKNAKILLSSGDITLAKNIFRVLVENGERLGVAYAGLGSCYELEGKTDLAIKAYREAIIYEPTFGCLLALSELYITKNQYENALGTLLRAQNLGKLSQSQRFEIHKSLGSCYMHLGQLNNAESHYRLCFEINPKSEHLHVNIGSLALKKGDPSTGLLHFKEAIRINIRHGKAYTGAGLAYLALGNKLEAHNYFAEGLSKDLQDTTALFNLVKCAYELKTFDQAATLLKKYIENNTVNSHILYSYAGILFHQGNYKQSLEECERLLTLKQDHDGAKKLLAMIKKSM
ncbi:MAG: tetratricopeptide repeat protein [Oligoflexia bacterium]|nr:tetratricopeptide repeat protein [Oligoflexia bacterium]